MKVAEEAKNRTTIIGRASEFAKGAHQGQMRLSGEPYFNHALATAQNLADWGMDETTIAAGLLHDVAEDTKFTLSDIEREFGPEVKFLVDGVTKLGKVKYRGAEEAQVENLRKMLIAMAEDLRVILIKLSDRLHNMKTLSFLPPQKQKRIALETAEIYAPLAYRLGMQRVSGELEDLSFPYVHPKEYQWLMNNVKYRYEEMERYLKKLQPVVEDALRAANIAPVAMDFRAKRYSSLYKKLLRYEMDLDKIFDLVAFRIIVKTVEECYAILGIIHGLWPPLPGRIKDYIAMPKPNGYRSLHTTVLGPDQKIVEFQIRTKEMHNEAENGIAAHWAYEQQKGTEDYLKKKVSAAQIQDINWVEQLRAWKKDFESAKEFLDSFKIDFFKERIFVITPKGEVIDLPQGATPVDFAYHIHSELGDQCVGAKVNGKIVPLDYKLKSQDIVEIIAQKGKKPSADWLDFVVTSLAKNHIKSALRKTTGLLKQERKTTEIKITAIDRVGLLKDISGIISRSHINISSVNSHHEGRGKFHVFKIRCETGDKDKIWRLILKLKNLPEVKEIDYRFL